MGKLLSIVSMALVIFWTSATAFAEAEYYTWIDENGITNYAERNPTGYDARFISSEQRFGYRGFGEAPDPAAERNQPDERAEAEEDEAPTDIDAEIAAETARIDQEIAAAKRSNCNIGKLNLAQLENYNRIRVKGDDGKVRVLTEEERQQRINKARETVRENCSG